jgi:GLPGLI family protein
MKTKVLMFIAGLFLATSVNMFAQEFEGKIVYSITYPKLDNPEMLGMLPKETTIYMKGDMTRVEANSGMGVKNITISNAKEKKATVLMDMLGQKFQIESTEAESDKDNPYKDAKVTITDETKMIAGYKCTKAIVDAKDNGKIDVYFTKELGVNSKNASGPFKQIDGAVLEYSMSQQGMNMKFTASSITKEKVADSKFTIPEGYTKVTKEELMKSMSGGR